MHFEILVEDRSGKRALDVLIPKIIGAQDTFRVTGYRGIGRVPQNLTPKTNADQRITQFPVLSEEVAGVDLRVDAETIFGRPTGETTVQFDDDKGTNG